MPRRTFLRGVGATVALPLLDAMVPALTALAQTPATPRTRFGAIYVPNGAIMEQWTPAAPAPGFELSPILKPLEPFQRLAGRGPQPDAGQPDAGRRSRGQRRRAG